MKKQYKQRVTAKQGSRTEFRVDFQPQKIALQDLGIPKARNTVNSQLRFNQLPNAIALELRHEPTKRWQRLALHQLIPLKEIASGHLRLRFLDQSFSSPLALDYELINQQAQVIGEGSLTLMPENPTTQVASDYLSLAHGQVTPLTLKMFQVTRAGKRKLKLRSHQGPLCFQRYDAQTRQWQSLRFPITIALTEIAAGRLRCIVDSKAPLNTEAFIDYALIEEAKTVAAARLRITLGLNQVTTGLGEIVGDLHATLVEDTKVTTYYKNEPDGTRLSGWLVANGLVRLSGNNTGAYGFVPCEQKGDLGHFSLTAEGQWRYAAANENPALQALAHGEIAQEKFTIQAINGALQTITINLHGLNDAPRLIASHDLTLIHPEGHSNHGDYVAALIESEDIDHGAVAGIAVTQVRPQHGEWQYSLDEGEHWQPIVRVVDSHALLLGATAKLRFVPQSPATGEGAITYRLWDQTIGIEGDYADTRHVSASSAFSQQQGVSKARLRDIAPTFDHLPTHIHLQSGEAFSFANYPCQLVYAEQADLADGRFFMKTCLVEHKPQFELFFLRSHPMCRTEIVQGNEYEYTANLFYAESLVGIARVINRKDGLKPAEAGIEIDFIGEHASLSAVTAILHSVGYISQSPQTEQNLQCSLMDAHGYRNDFMLIVTTQISPSAQSQRILPATTEERLLGLQDFPYYDLAHRPLHSVYVMEQSGSAGQLFKWELATQQWRPLIAPFQLQAREFQQGHVKFVPTTDWHHASLPLVLKFSVSNGSTWSDAAKLEIQRTPEKITERYQERLTGRVEAAENGLIIAQGMVRKGREIGPQKQLFAEKQHLMGTFGYLNVDTHGVWIYRLNRQLPAVQQLGAGSLLSDDFVLTTLDNTAVPIRIQVVGCNESPHVIESREFSEIDTLADQNPGNYVSEIFLSEDPDENAEEGLAVTQVDNSHGIWQYSLDQGHSWKNFEDIKESHALLLGLDAKIRFVPNRQNPAHSTIEYRAWDQTEGSEGDFIDASHPVAHGALSDNKGVSSIHLRDLTPHLVNLIQDRVLETGKITSLAYPATRLETTLNNLHGLRLSVFTLPIPGEKVHERIQFEPDHNVKISAKVSTAHREEGTLEFEGVQIASFVLSYPSAGKITQASQLTVDFWGNPISSQAVLSVFKCIAYVNYLSHQPREIFIEICDASGEISSYCIRTIANQRPLAKPLSIPIVSHEARVLAKNDFQFSDDDQDSLIRIELQPVKLALGKLYLYQSNTGLWQPIDRTTLIGFEQIDQGYLKFVANDISQEHEQTILNYKVYDGLLWSDGAPLSFISQEADQSYVTTLPVVALHVTGLDTGLNETLRIDGQTLPIQVGQNITTEHGYTVSVLKPSDVVQCKVSGAIKPSQIRSLVSQPSRSLTGHWSTDITLPDLATSISVEGKALQIIPFESTITIDNPSRSLGSNSKIQIVQTGALYSQLAPEQALCINTAFSQYNDSALRGIEAEAIPVATQGNILRLVGDDAELDLSRINTNTVRNIQVIDLGAEDSQAHQLTLTASQAIQLSQDSPQHHLIVEGGKYDKIKFKSNDGGTWKLLKDEEVIDNNHYHVYQGSVKGQKVNVYVNALMAA